MTIVTSMELTGLTFSLSELDLAQLILHPLSRKTVPKGSVVYPATWLIKPHDLGAFKGTAVLLSAKRAKDHWSCGDLTIYSLKSQFDHLFVKFEQPIHAAIGFVVDQEHII